MKFWSHIAISCALAFGPVVDAMAAPLASRLDVEQLCRYSQPRQSPFAGVALNGEPSELIQPSNADILSPDGPSRTPREGDLRVNRRDPLAHAMEARDYVEARGRHLLRNYKISVDADHFHFLPYDPEVGLLGLTFTPRASLFDGEVTARWVEPQALYFQVSAEEAETLEALRATNAISVLATVQLASREDAHRPICTQHENGVTEIELLLVQGVLTTNATREVLHDAPTERLTRVECEARVHQLNTSGGRSALTPNVRVINVSAEGESYLPQLEASMLQLLAETELHGCYMQALKNNAALQGALVIEFSFDESGAVSETGVLIDAANNSALTRCTMQALESARIPRTRAGTPLAVRMNLIFARH